MAAYHANRHDCTGFSSNLLMFGRENNAPVDAVCGFAGSDAIHYRSYDEFVDRKMQVMRESYQLAPEHVSHNAERLKRNFNMLGRPCKYAVRSVGVLLLT